MILVNHNACNENKSAIKIYASFSVLFSSSFFTNSTNSIAHYNKESRFSAFKKGTNSSLGWVEGFPSSWSVSYLSSFPKWTWFSLHLAKNHNKKLVFPKLYKLHVHFTKQRGTHHFTKHKKIMNRRFHNSGQHSKGLFVNI